MKTNKKLFLHSLLINVIFIISAATVTHAATTVSGIIKDGTVWNKAGSPYLISEPVEVPDGVTLSIEPGTIVKLGNGTSSIEVYGVVNALGTESEPITFTSWYDDSIGGDTDGGILNGDGAARTPMFEDWNGVNFWAGSSHLSHVNVRYGWVHGSGASLDIDNSLFQFSELSMGGPGSLMISDSRFEDQHGISIEIHPELATTIERTTIDRSNREAIQIWGATVTANKLTITNTKPNQVGNAIELSDHATLTLSDSTLDSGTVGIKLSGPNTIHVSNSVIKNFSSGGVLDTPGAVLALAEAKPTISYALVSNHVVPSSSMTASSDDFGGGDISIDTTEIAANGIGIRTRSESTTAIHNNSIHDNGVGAEGDNFENNWWGDASGPHDEVNNTSGHGDEVPEWVDYTPWLTVDPLVETPIPTCCSNVAFLPGIEASRLYTSSGSKLWEPFTNADVKKLYMNAQGTSIDQTIYTKDVLDQFTAFNLVGTPIYRSFIQEMNGMVSDGTIKAWKALPYDWRQAVTDVISNGAKLQDSTMNMEHEIELLAANSNTGKVTIIAHSNGGLVAKALMLKLKADGKENLIDKIVFVAVPQLGTPDAVAALLHGMSFPPGGIIMNKPTSRSLAENMPGAYGLLPSESYFGNVTDPVITFDQSVKAVGNFIEKYGTAITSKNALDDFLSGKDGRTKPSEQNTNPPNVLNQTLLAQATSIHQLLDNWQPPTGVDLIEIAGMGVDTIKGIKYIGKYPCTKLITSGACKPYLDEEPILTKDGDNTVVYPSAVFGVKTKSLYVDLGSFANAEGSNYEHKDILEFPPLAGVIKGILKGEEENTQFISDIKPNYSSIQSLEVSVHSPATIDIYDAQGRHTGLLQNQNNSEITQFEEEIPNSYYMEFGEGKYVGFNESAGSAIKIQGTGAGTITLNVEHKMGDTVTKTEMFADIPVTPNTKAQVLMNQNTTQLALDTDGNGTNDFTIQPTGNNPDDSIDPILFLKIMKQNIHSLGLPPIIEKAMMLKIDLAIKFSTKDKRHKIASLIKQFSRSVEGKHWGHTRKLSTDQRNSLIEMISKLIDTIK